MTDTIVVQDNFSGSAGTLDGHVPDTIASGTAVYDTPSGMLLNGSGQLTLPNQTVYAVLRGSTVDPSQGLYFEVVHVAALVGGTGSGVMWMDLGPGIDSGDLPFCLIRLFGPTASVIGSANDIVINGSDGTTVLSGATPTYATPGATVTLRIEQDPYAKTTKFFVNSVLLHTTDDSAWYLGTETFAPSSWTLTARNGYELNPWPVGSGTPMTDQLTIGTLGLGGGVGTPNFWGDFVNSFEIDG